MSTTKLIILLLAIIAVGQCVWVKEMENPGMFEGDIQLDPDERKGVLKTNSYGSIKGGRWPYAKIPYVIDGSIDSYGQAAINAAIADYHKYTCLRFHKRGYESAYINFFNYGGGCSSPVGYLYGRRNDVSIGNGCRTKGIVMHEIGHSIGILHEQSRPDRDAYVNILWNNIQKGMEYNFYTHNNIDSLGTPYDFKSLMHYGPTAFGNGRTTIQPKYNVLIGQRNGFSPTDIKQINLMYCGSNKK